MRIVFHAGMNKTGSTAIQQSLSSHRDLLIEHSILYPKLSDVTHHSELLLCCLDDDEYTGNFNRNDPNKRKSGVARSEKLWQLLKEEIEQHRPANLILSSEFVFGLRPASLARLETRLQEFSPAVDYIVYLRDPRDHYLSSAQQILKYGAQVKDPLEYQAYVQKIQKFERLKDSKLSLRVYARDVLFKRDIVRDFLSAVIGKKLTRQLSLARQESNTSISAEAMDLLQRFNAEVWSQRRIVGNKVNRQVLEAIAKEERALGCTRPNLLDSVANLVLQTHAKDLNTLKLKYEVLFPSVDYEKISLILDEDHPEKTATSSLRIESVEDIVKIDALKAEALIFKTMARLARASSERS